MIFTFKKKILKQLLQSKFMILKIHLDIIPHFCTHFKMKVVTLSGFYFLEKNYLNSFAHNKSV